MKVMKKGFTLAEVLITLAIIGVVAALTIPTVVTNYKAKALETQKKKAMSVLANGFRLLMAEENVTLLLNTGLVTCEGRQGFDKLCLANEIKKAFNVITDNNVSNEIFNTKYNFISGQREVWTNSKLQYVFVTSDGMIFGLIPHSGGIGSGIDVLVDINGVKNPNKGAEDLCRFAIRNTGAIEDYCSLTDDWGAAIDQGGEVAILACDPNDLSSCSNEFSCKAAGGTWGCFDSYDGPMYCGCR